MKTYSGITCRAYDKVTGRVSLIRSDAPTIADTVAFAKAFSTARGGGLIMFIDCKTASAVNDDMAQAKYLAKRDKLKGK